MCVFSKLYSNRHYTIDCSERKHFILLITNSNYEIGRHANVPIIWASKHLQYYHTFSFHQISYQDHLEVSPTNQISWVNAVP